MRSQEVRTLQPGKEDLVLFRNNHTICSLQMMFIFKFLDVLVTFFTETVQPTFHARWQCVTLIAIKHLVIKSISFCMKQSKDWGCDNDDDDVMIVRMM